MKKKPKMIDIPSGPQGGLVYNPDPYKTFLSPYRLRDLARYMEQTKKSWEDMTAEEREQFRIPGR